MDAGFFLPVENPCDRFFYGKPENECDDEGNRKYDEREGEVVGRGIRECRYVGEFANEFELPCLGFADDDVMEQVDGEGARTDEVDDSGGNPVRLDEGT